MNTSLPLRLLPSLLILGLGANPAAAQYPPAGAPPAPSAAPLRSEPLVLDERELEQAVREGQGTGQPRTEWAIAPAPAAPPTPAAGRAPLSAPAPLATSPASTPAPAPWAAPAPSATPASAGIPYVSGGVGYDERERMEAVKSQYNLRLLFALSGTGSYLSGVKVRLQDSRGASLIDTTANGPWFFAQLPPGAYVLSLDHEGQVQQRNLRIGPQGAVVENIYWTGPVATFDPTQAAGPAGSSGGYPPAASPSYPPLPPLMTSTGIPYLSGGENPAERARMEASSDQYNLRLNFKIATAKPQTSPIRVRLLQEGTDRSLFEAEAKGPLFLARIPPGQYRVSLKYQGRDYEQKVSVPGYGSATASFEWTD